MNVKLHTPNSLKTGSGMATMKQFLLSLVATTISIVLTFGTAAFLDNRKKEEAKREMVMMVIYDIDKTVKLVERGDSVFRKAAQAQAQVALHPESFDSLRDQLFPALVFSYNIIPQTTEKIFSSNIETFTTIGNVNFISEVSSFYSSINLYREVVLDSLKKEIEKTGGIYASPKSFFAVSFASYGSLNRSSLLDFKSSLRRCMKMMDVSEKDLQEFSSQQVDNESEKEDEDNDEVLKEFAAEETQITKALEKYIVN